MAIAKDVPPRYIAERAPLYATCAFYGIGLLILAGSGCEPEQPTARPAPTKKEEEKPTEAKKTPLGKLEALRQAQLWMLREGGKRGFEFKDDKTGPPAMQAPPYFWAAFVLSGDWR